MSASPRDFYYSSKYNDDKYEYRHVHVPKDLVELMPKDRLMSEKEWRSLGIQQSQGWVHYMIHNPERHVCYSVPFKKIFFCCSSTILLFRRPLKDVIVCAENNENDKEEMN
ncbi:unnamed protein product [Onchocerca flexuosa]|uniref:Cyclin-dependent kinases regulatory subunit n=1 Tax=Onchocerca flexuosa TaxID=387005 RepID=A0A183H269_9BILA|nr:unnamed protein product [Onchocerca flexuosa]